MRKPLNVLLLEDRAADAQTILRELKKAGYDVNSERHADAHGYLEALLRGDWDVILADYEMPGFSGLEALEIMQAYNIDLPFIVISGAISEETAVSAMRAGAHDYCLKNNLTRLTAAIERELTDVKERRKRRHVERELKSAEERFKRAFEASPIATMIFRLEDDIIIDANQRFLDLCGLDSVEQHNIYDLALWEETAYEMIDACHSIQDYEATLWRHGEKRCVLVSTEIIMVNEQMCVLAMLHDHTERIQTLNQLSTLQNITSSLSTAISQRGVAEVVLDHTQKEFGAAMAFISRFDEKRGMLDLLEGSNLSDWARGEMAQISLDDNLPITDVILNGEPDWMPAIDDVMVDHPSHPLIEKHNNMYKAWAALPLITDNMVIGGLCLSFEEPQVFDDNKKTFLMAVANQCAQALDRARLYDNEQQARLLAEEANNLKTEFLAMISHELRTPLGSIKGFTSTLLAEDVTWGIDDQREFISTIETEADKLTELVNQLLDISGMQAGKLHIAPSEQDIMDILSVVMPQIHSILAREQHYLDPQIPVDVPKVMADDQRIGQVLVNLIDNAAKYSPPHHLIVLRAMPYGDYLKVVVSDNGVGIDPADRERVFDMFHQTKRDEYNKGGTGLGLTICKRLVEAHGGEIWIEPAEDKGTTIAFTLPVA